MTLTGRTGSFSAHRPSSPNTSSCERLSARRNSDATFSGTKRKRPRGGVSTFDDAEASQARQDAGGLGRADLSEAGDGAQAELTRGLRQDGKDPALRPRDNCLHGTTEVHTLSIPLINETIVSLLEQPPDQSERPLRCNNPLVHRVALP